MYLKSSVQSEQKGQGFGTMTKMPLGILAIHIKSHALHFQAIFLLMHWVPGIFGRPGWSSGLQELLRSFDELAGGKLCVSTWLCPFAFQIKVIKKKSDQNLLVVGYK